MSNFGNTLYSLGNQGKVPGKSMNSGGYLDSGNGYFLTVSAWGELAIFKGSPTINVNGTLK